LAFTPRHKDGAATMSHTNTPTIQPFYQDETTTIYNADCREVMPILKGIDAVVTSPPYDSLRDYSGYSFDFEAIAHNISRCVRTGGCVVWVVADQVIDGSESGNSFKQALFFKDECGLNLHDTMIYLKDSCPYPEAKRYRQVFEYMFIFSKGIPTVFNPLKKRNIYRGIQRNSFRQKTGETTWDAFSVGDEGLAYNVWQYSAGYMKSTKYKPAFEHPAIFPEYLAKDHIQTWTNADDIVLDPFMGSGTTGASCVELNRRFIGIEISKEYCELAVRRIKEAKMQPALFGGVANG
jgi:DNA modification methylase